MAGPNVEMANAECTENDVTESAIRPTLTQNGIRLPTAKDVDARRRAQRKRCVSVFEEGSSYKRMAVAAALQKSGESNGKAEPPASVTTLDAHSDRPTRHTQETRPDHTQQETQQQCADNTTPPPDHELRHLVVTGRLYANTLQPELAVQRGSGAELKKVG